MLATSSDVRVCVIRKPSAASETVWEQTDLPSDLIACLAGGRFLINEMKNEMHISFKRIKYYSQHTNIYPTEGSKLKFNSKM